MIHSVMLLPKPTRTTPGPATRHQRRARLLAGCLLALAAGGIIVALSSHAAAAAGGLRVARAPQVQPSPSPGSELATILNALATPHRKDVWDKLSSVAGIVQGVLVALIGFVITVMYNRRQSRAEDLRAAQERHDRELQVVKSFLPLLGSADQKRKKAAFATLAYLGNEELAADVGAIYGDGDGYDVLNILESRDGGSVRDDQVDVIYWIDGGDGSQDHVQVRFLSAATGSRPCRWRLVEVGVAGASARHRTFSDLGLTTQRPGQLPPRFQAVAEGEYLAGRVMFDPPLGTKATRWLYTYRWSGLWNPLRTPPGEDVGAWVVVPNTKRLRIWCVLPASFTNPHLDPLEPAGAGTVGRTQVDNQTVLCWNVRNPRAGNFEYRVSTGHRTPQTKRPNSSLARTFAAVRKPE